LQEKYWTRPVVPAAGRRKPRDEAEDLFISQR
jgi:hypothetical protein